MAKLNLGKLIGGFADDLEPSTAVEARSNQYTRSNGIDLFKTGYSGYISPARTFAEIADSGTVINSYLVSSATDVKPATGAKTYMITSTAPKIVEEDAGAVQVASAVIAHGGHTTIVGEDVIIYTGKISSTVTRSLFYSYNDDTDGNIGRITLNDTPANIGTLDDDFMSVEPAGNSVMTKGVPHKMCEGADLVMYITNGQWIASYDGNDADADGKFNVNALNCGNGWTTIDVRPYKNYIAICCIYNANETVTSNVGYKSKNKILLWDGFSPEPNFVYEISDNRLSAIMPANGDLYAFTDGSSNTTKLWKFNGASFIKIAEQLTTLIGQAPRPRCIDYFEDSLIWASANTAAIIQYGKLSSNVKGLHYTMQNTTNVTDASATTGLLRNVEQSVIRVSGLYSGTYKLLQTTGGGYLTGVGGSALAQLVTRSFILPHRSTINKITIYFAQLGTGASVTLSLFKNKNTLSIGGATDLLNKTLTATGLTAGTESFSWETNIDDIDSFYMSIKFDHAAVTDTAAIIRDIEFEITPTNAY